MKTTFNILMGLALASMTLAAAQDELSLGGVTDNSNAEDTISASAGIDSSNVTELRIVVFYHIAGENGLYYDINEDGVSATFYGINYGVSGNEEDEYGTIEGDFEVPAVFNYEGKDYPVTSIGWGAFSGCVGLTSVDIPASVTKIGPEAFSGCVGLTSVDIPASVSEIGGSAFEGCSGLTSVDIPSSVTEIGGYVFKGCVGLTSVTIPASVTAIGWGAFSDCAGLTSVDIPASVTEISEDAFRGCDGLTSVTIPASVTKIGDGAFARCSGLTKITVDKRNPFYDSRDNCNAIIESATNALIAGCKSTHISVSVTGISEDAFAGCVGLTSVTIPSSVTGIGDGAFAGCSGLTSVTIPASVTGIGWGAFSDCESMKAVRCLIADPDEVEIGDDVFDGVDASSCVLYVPEQAVERYKALEPWNGFTIRALPE